MPNNLKLTIVIPVLNEADNIDTLLKLLGSRFPDTNCLVVDGGSNDDTCQRAKKHGARVIKSSSGRARQMNIGARQTDAEVYWFIHADTQPPENAVHHIERALKRGHVWGRFNVRLSGHQRIFRVIERFMNLRSCSTGIATGDQGIFVRADIFNLVDGYPDIPLMEDIALSQRLKTFSRPACIKSDMKVSSRRWESHGIWRTIVLMWYLRLRFFLGTPAAKLHQIYYAQ